MKFRSAGDVGFHIANGGILTCIFVVMIVPFLYVFNYSISESHRLGPWLFLFPQGFDLTAYRVIFTDPAVLHGIFISVSRTLLGTALAIFITSMAGYVLTKDQLVGVKFFRRYFVFTLYFSGGIIPTYILMKELLLTNSFLVYVIPGAAGVFNMILIKTFIENLPNSLEESAMIDGANDYQIFSRIVLPMSLPVIAAITLFVGINQWNAFIDTQLYNALNPDLFTLQYVLYNILQSNTNIREVQMLDEFRAVTPESIKMAMTVITIAPILVVYPFLQKYFIKGLLIGAIKG